MEASTIDKAWQLFSALMRNYPLWPSTFSTCDCKRGMGRGCGKCALCLEEELAQQVGPIAARRATRAMVEICEAWEEVKESAEQRANGSGERGRACATSARPRGSASSED